MILFRLLLLFTIVPLVEFYLLFKLAEATSFLATVGVVLVTGFVGAWLARWQGFQTLQRFNREMSQGVPPTDALADGLLILLAAAFLVTPGLLTDSVGFALLIPPLRGAIKSWVWRNLRDSAHIEFYGQGPHSQYHSSSDDRDEDEAIEVEVVPPSQEKKRSEDS